MTLSRTAAFSTLPAVQPLVGARVALQRCPILRTSGSIVPRGGPAAKAKTNRENQSRERSSTP